MTFRIFLSDISGSIFDFLSHYLKDDIDIVVAHTIKLNFS